MPFVYIGQPNHHACCFVKSSFTLRQLHVASFSWALAKKSRGSIPLIFTQLGLLYRSATVSVASEMI